MTMVSGGHVHCLSFDVEEHFQVSAFESPVRRRHWVQIESRVERNTNKILDLLADSQVHATFFVLGWVAERHPGLVRRIMEEGHEVASHGYAHELVTVQTPRTFREDVRRAKRVLEDILSLTVHGYRAPSFSITRETMWALPILVEEGYTYDSSVFPALRWRYRILGKNRSYHKITTYAGTLWEIPLSTVRVFGFQVPVAGGGYFRLFPYALLRQLLKKIERTGYPLVMYLHPWELDPDQPRMDGPLFSRFRHYLNLHKTENRLNALLEDFSFGPIQKVIGPIAHLCHEQAGCGMSSTSPVEVLEDPTTTPSPSAKGLGQVSG
jgi:polysaccharide deacetylase family protein (PEP-CTERM system associated)